MPQLFRRISGVTPLLAFMLIVVGLSACDIQSPQGATPTAVPSSSTSSSTVPISMTLAIPVPTPKDPNAIVTAGFTDPGSLDPALDYESGGIRIIDNVYEPLLFRKKDTTDQFIPMLATKWDISNDGKIYTFQIRKGVKFAEGQDLTPEDVAYSFWRGMMQDAAGGPQWMILQTFFGSNVQSFKDDVVGKQNGNNWIAACEAVKKAVTYDNAGGTVTMHLNKSFGPTLQVLSGPWGSILSKLWVVKQGGWNGDCAGAEKYHDPKPEQDELFKAMNGTGPYKLERWTPGEGLSLLRNDSYWRTEPLYPGGPTGPARIQRVAWKSAKEWGTRLAMLKTGDTDFAATDPQFYTQLDPLVAETCDDLTGQCTLTSNNSAFLRMSRGRPSTVQWQVEMNEQINTTGDNNRIGSGKLDGKGVPPDFFSDVHVRKAFSYSYDWATVIDQILHGDAQQSLGPIPAGMLGYDPNQPHYTHDLTKAAEEFKASNLKSSDGKSLWDTGFTLTYLHTSDATSDNERAQGQILKESLAKINPKFHLEIADEPFAAYRKEWNDGRAPLGPIAWFEDYHDPQDWVLPYLSSQGYYGANSHFPKDLQSKLDSLINQGVDTTDTQARAAIYQQLQNMAYENALYIFSIQPHDRTYEPLYINGTFANPVVTVGAPYYYYALSKGK